MNMIGGLQIYQPKLNRKSKKINNYDMEIKVKTKQHCTKMVEK